MSQSERRRSRIGSSFDDLLRDEGTHAEVTARGIKRVVAHQLEQLRREQGISKAALASRIDTSRSQLDRLLDPDNESVTLGTLVRAAKAVGRRLHLELR